MRGRRAEKLDRVDDQTLIVGIDIAKSRHWGAAINWRGYELCKRFGFGNHAAGFARLGQRIERLKEEHGLRRVIIGLEPSGHYWKNPQG